MMVDGPIPGDSGFLVASVMTDGIAIAMSGLAIVFVVLVLISLFIAWLPRMLELVAHVWPEVQERHSAEVSGEVYPESLVPDDGAALAAIGFVLHTELQRQLAAEQGSGGKA